MNVRFGSHSIDYRRQRLLRDGVVVPLEPKVFEVLRYLAERHERVVTKAELLAHVWGGEAVSEAVLPNNVAVLRRALGQARGASEPIETVHGRGYRFAAPLTPESEDGAQDVTAGAAGELFGRAAVWRRLHARLAEARAGSGRMVVVSGAAGIGKTSLVESFLSTAAGISVWVGRCPDGAGAPPLWPWLQVLRACAEELDAAGLSRWLGAEQAWLEPWITDPLAADVALDLSQEPSSRRFHRLDATARLLCRAGADTARVLWIEDAQLADEPSLNLLEHLAGQLGRSRLLVIVTVRADPLPLPRSAGDPWLRVLRMRAVDHLRLEGLAEPDALQWLTHLSAGALPRAVARALWAQTEGNPLFMRDAFQNLPSAVADRGFELRLSSMAHALLRQRLHGVPEPTLHVLRVASVVGPEVSLSLLQRVTGLDHAALLDALDEATAQGLLSPSADEPGMLRFGQRLLCHSLRAELSSSRRAQLHLAVAGALAEQSAGSVEALQHVAYHLHRALPAADGRLAVESAVRAAHAAERAGALGNAVELHRLAIEASAYDTQSSVRDRARLQARHARALWMAGQHRAALEALYGAADGARRAQQGAALAEVAVVLSELAADPLCPPLSASRLLHEALGAHAAPDEPTRGLLLSAWAARRLDEPQSAEHGFERALAALGDGQQPEIECCRAERSRLGYWLARAEYARCIEGAQALGRRLDALESNGDPAQDRTLLDWLSCEARRLLCVALASSGQAPRLEGALGEWGALAARSQSPALQAQWLIFGAEQALARGRLELAAERAARLDALQPAGERGALEVHRKLFEIRLRMLRGGAPAQPEELHALQARCDRGDDWRRVVLGWLAARSGARDEALRSVEECLPRALARGVPQLWELCALAECVARVGHREGALSLLAALESALESAPAPQAMGPLFQSFGAPVRQLGLLEHFLGRVDRARQRFESAVEANARLGLLTHVLGCRFALGQVLLAHGQPKRRAAGQRLLQAAEREAKALGITSRDAPLERGVADADELPLQ